MGRSEPGYRLGRIARVEVPNLATIIGGQVSGLLRSFSFITTNDGRVWRSYILLEGAEKAAA